MLFDWFSTSHTYHNALLRNGKYGMHCYAYMVRTVKHIGMHCYVSWYALLCLYGTVYTIMYIGMHCNVYLYTM